MQHYAQHPLSAAFPAMGAAEYQALKDSVQISGVLNDITILDDMVLDGWHRYQAALEFGQTCGVKQLEAWIDPRDFVLAQNKHRRHITQAQLAMATTAVYSWASEGKPKLDTECPVKTSSELAEIAGVHASTIKQAKAVQTHAAPEVVEAVKRGEIGLPKAAAIAKLPKEQQAEAITKPTPKPVVQPDPLPEDAPEHEEYTELDAAHDQISELQAELVVARMGEVATEEKTQAAEYIAELQAEIKTLKATLKAANLSRDFLMEENAQMKKQMQMQRREIEKLKGGK
jgi:hypothetical protein